MAIRVKSDTLAMVADWLAGKPVRTIELGHIHRSEEHPGMSTTINTTMHVRRDQERAHEYCFRILAHYIEKSDFPPDYNTFAQDCENLAAGLGGLTEEEKIGAESLAWKALVVGWRKAIDGHKDVDYIEVKREEVRP